MAASSSTAASTSSDPNSNNSSFDVFISHHGGDTKKTFASHLYHRLHSYGLKAFLDRPELQRGDDFKPQIRGAIRAASVNVAILSLRYAESKWCLNELQWMCTESKAPIIPVFYHVEPAELTSKDGVYAQALLKLEQNTTDDPETQASPERMNKKPRRNDPPAHQKRYDPATVEQWGSTLKKVSGKSGFDLSDYNGDEGILLQKVIESVLKYVKKPLDVAKHPTGLDEKIAEFENKVLLPHLQSLRKPYILGIVGLGGAGKTTMAKELFNRKSSQYSRFCFLDDVRETVNKGSLLSLQNILLKKLTGTDLQLSSKDGAITKLKKHLPSQEILLILDDVDKLDQVDSLVPNLTSIHPKSLILITSRDRDVLTRSGVEESCIYKLKGLNEQHSLELFCWHAFRRSYPPTGFEDLSEKFVKACNGLPLSLKVFGALLCGNTETSFWHRQLDKLLKTLPSEIQERLRISYEALESDEKQMFLDIACFFLGENRDTAIRIWNGSGWGGELGFQTLQNKCLVEVVEVVEEEEEEEEWKGSCSLQNKCLVEVVEEEEEEEWNGSCSKIRSKIRMHDHLRDLGRAEARVSQPLRFWRVDDLLEQSSVMTVRGIRMVLSENRDNVEELDNDDFDCIQLRRLKLVDTEGMLLERILKSVKFPYLIWLQWKQCPYSSLPSWIPMKKLRVLRVSGSWTLQTLLEPESQLPPCLEELSVHGCVKLKRISGLEHATKLQELDVHGCTQLEELQNMESLVSLKVLWAQSCVKLKSIPGLEHATKLQKLDVHGCTELEELRLPNMESLVSLEHLCAIECVKLKSIPGLEHATKLQSLKVHWCTELEELPNMELLVSLEHLWAQRCVKLKSIPGLEHAKKLQKLDVGCCTELEELPNMKSLVSLAHLWASGCVKLKSIPGLEHATKLQELYVHGCTELEELPNMELLVSLEELVASGCVKLKSIPGLEHARKLRRLEVDRCTDLEELPNMERLVSLEELHAMRCVKLKSIPGLEHATKLQRLFVEQCTELEELPNMESLVYLELLWAQDCVKLKNIRGLEHATQLRSLYVTGCWELEEVEGVEHCLERLKVLSEEVDHVGLDVSGCPKLQCPTWE